jgi:transposase
MLHTMGSNRYSTDPSDTEWECLRAYLPAPGKKRGRPSIHGLRAILDAVFFYV